MSACHVGGGEGGLAALHHIYIYISVAIWAHEAIHPLLMGDILVMAAVNDIFAIHPMARWWVEDAVGPLNLDELICEVCCNFIVSCRYEELFTGRYRYACNYCSALALLGHNTLWSLEDLYWLHDP